MADKNDTENTKVSNNGDNKSTEVAVVNELAPSAGLEAVRPRWMKDNEESVVRKSLAEFVAAIRENPTDIRLSTKIYKLGEEGGKELMPHTNLYEKKIAGIMEVSKEGSPVNKSLLSIKQELDTINPAMLSKQPITVKALVIFKKARLPKAEEVLDMIYARRETVKSTIDGLKRGLWEMRDGLMDNIADLIAIYEGLLKGQRLIERDIYFGQLLHGEIKLILDQTTDGIAKQNLEQVQADLTTQVINLQTEENANMQFFAGAQAIAKMTNQQVGNINGMTRLLERSVLANLGLRVATMELGKSIEVTEQMKNAIGETIADTGRQINRYGDQLTDARSKAMINIESLREGCSQMEAFFEKQANANKLIIEKGIETSRQLVAMTGRLRERVEGGHETMKALSGEEKTEEKKSK